MTDFNPLQPKFHLDTKSILHENYEAIDNINKQIRKVQKELTKISYELTQAEGEHKKQLQSLYDEKFKVLQDYSDHQEWLNTSLKHATDLIINKTTNGI